MCEEQMVRGGKVTNRKNFKKRLPPKDKGSDDSDEDYVVSDYENGVSEDYCSSLDRYASGEDNFIVEEEEEEEEEEVEEHSKQVRKTAEPNARNGFGSRRVKNKKERKRRRFSYEEEGDDEDYKVDDDNDYEEEEEEEDVDEEVEDEDFTPEEEDFSDEEELFVRTKGNNVKPGRKGVRKNTKSKVCKRKRPKPAKKYSRNTGRKRRRQTLKISDEDDDYFSDDDHAMKKARRRRTVPKRKRYVEQSGLEMLVSGSSDFEYTISEEEREQVREAEKMCLNLRTRMRSVLTSQKVEDLDLRQRRKPPARKGKEKVEEVKVKVDVVKQVCGICLSEEDKRRVRGTLNCCSHFFCFSCIMEWGKVESRCPLCKQRFQTISKPARSSAGIDLREVVIQVPERDQVYQPSEEELRSYLDPYENVICIMCHEGGDDNLMLLCDLCDSPAHTYCVGLGREVPDGNWYCLDCRTSVLGSSSSQPSSRLSDRRTTNNWFNRPLPVANREGLDLNSLSSPGTPYVQGFGHVLSPRFPADVQSSSPVSQAVAPTLTRRRFLRLHINQIRSSNQMGFVNNINDGVSAANQSVDILNSPINQSRETTLEHTRAQQMEVQSQTLFGESLLCSPAPLAQHGVFLDSESSHLSGQAMQDPHVSLSTQRTCNEANSNPLRRPLPPLENTTMTSIDGNLNGTQWHELLELNSLSCFDHIPDLSSVLNPGSDIGLPPPLVRNEKEYCAAREQLQPFIESHLNNLSRDIDLGESSSADIASKATCTILAACGFEGLVNDPSVSAPTSTSTSTSTSSLTPVLPPSRCSHIDLLMRGGEGQGSLIKGVCSSCFDAFVGDVVKKITEASLSSWLSLTL